MWPVKSVIKSSDMWSMTKSSHMWSVQPAMTQSTYKKSNQEFVCDDKNCQSTKSVCDDKNCQSTQCNHMHPVKSAMISNHMQSVRPTMLQSSNKKHTYENVSS